MGQVDVLEVLENSKTPLSAAEISKILGECEKKIHFIIHKLEKHKEIEYFELNKDLAMKFFKSKRKLKLYYLP